MIDQETVRKIKDAADIVEVVSDYVSLNRRGSNYMGLCPFHNEKTPSFSVSPKRNFCYCFSCHKGGSPVNFIMEKEGISYHDALLHLAKKYNIRVEEKELTEEERRKISEREAMIVANTWAMNYFHTNLYETQDGRDIGLAYLYGRGLTDAAIKNFKLGYSSDNSQSFVNAAKTAGFDLEVMASLGLIGHGQHGGYYDKFRGRVMFPIRNASGNAIAFGGRDLKGGPAKYINSPETLLYKKSNELYGLYSAKTDMAKLDKVYLMEGYLDVISSWQSGLKNVVASSGTALTDGQIALLHRYTDNVTLIYDGDAAGIKASLRGMDMLLAHKMHVKVLLLPDGDDPDSFAQKNTEESFLRYIEENEKDIIEFKTEVLMNSAKKNPQERSRAIESVVDSIACIPNDIERTLYVQRCSMLMNIDEKTVARAVQQKRKQIIRKLMIEREKRPFQDNTSRVSSSSQESNQSTSNPGTTDFGSGNAGESDNDVQTIDVSRNSPDQKLRQIEKEILKYCVRYGFVDFGEPEDDEEDKFYVIDFVKEEFNADGIEFSHPPFKTTFSILHEIREEFIKNLDSKLQEIEKVMKERRETVYEEISIKGLSTGEIRKEEKKLEEELESYRNEELKKFSIRFSGEFLINHENDDVRKLATEMLHEPHQLSAIYFKNGQKVQLEEDKIEEIVTRTISEYRAEVLNLRIRELQQQIKNTEESDSPEDLKELMTKYQKLLGMRSKISGELGDRIISPR